MAILTVIAKLVRDQSVSDGTQRVVEDGDVANTEGSPTLEEFIQLEALDNRVVNVITPSMIITVSASDLNSA
jgi:hypothetical protein